MSRRDRNTSGRPVARAAAKYTVYNVTEPAELMEFLMKKMAGISRTRVKALLTNRVVLVDNNIQTLYNYPLKPGMKVQISREKNKHEFQFLFHRWFFTKKACFFCQCAYNKRTSGQPRDRKSVV